MKFLTVSIDEDGTSINCEFNQDILMTFTFTPNGKSTLTVFEKKEDCDYLLLHKKFNYIPNMETLTTEIQTFLKTRQHKNHWILVGEVNGLSSAITQLNQHSNVKDLREQLIKERKRLIKEVITSSREKNNPYIQE